MKKEKKYFELSLDALRSLCLWAIDSAERVLPIYERETPGDSRPRDALEEARLFAGGGKRSAKLRKLGMDAYRASRESEDPAASAAAMAACLAASAAYTHPLADVAQTRHVVGPAAYAALALELDEKGRSPEGDGEVNRAVERVSGDVSRILLNMPARTAGKTRIDRIMYDLDMGLRAKFTQ